MSSLNPVPAASGANTIVDENFDATSPAGMYGRRAQGFDGTLKWFYYGGRGFGNTVADGFVTLTGSATNYVVANRSTGAVSAATSTTNWNDTAAYLRLYTVLTGTATVTSYVDYRESYSGSAFTGGTLTTALNEAPQVTIASASSVAIGAAAANTVLVSGTTTITSFDSIAAGAIRRVRFLGILTLTHNATSLILPGSANITTAVGDVATFESLGSGNWRCINYSRADGSAVAGAGSGTVTSVDASGGVETAAGTPITSTGAIRASTLVNAQTGTTYTYLTGDRGKLVTHTNAAAIAATLPQATSTFGAGWSMRVKNKGAGTLTITPTTSTIEGSATLALTTGQWAIIVSDGTNYQADVYAPSGGGGSLTNWTEGANSSSPNATVPVVSFTATNGATNVDAAIEAKGTGATIAQVPLANVATGNKRGSYATDWQKSRTVASQVASGTGAVIGGGAGNTSSGTQTVVGGGSGNNASSAQSAIAGGFSNTANNAGAFVGGGQSNTASATNSVVAGGNTNTASGDSSTVSGGATNSATALGAHVTGGGTNTADGNYSRAGGLASTTRGVQGADVWSGYNGGSAGLAQSGNYSLVSNTTDATPTVMTATASAAAASNQVKLNPNESIGFDGMVVARKSGSTDYKVWSLSGAASQGANNAATTLDAGGTPAVVFASAGASTWALAVTADTTNGCLQLTLTGQAATTIRTQATIRTAEVVRS